MVIFTMYVGGINRRLLTAWSTAGVLGPLGIKPHGAAVGVIIPIFAASAAWLGKACEV